MIELLAILLFLGLLIGAVLGWVAVLQLRGVKREIAALRGQLGQQISPKPAPATRQVPGAPVVSDTWTGTDPEETPLIVTRPPAAGTKHPAPEEPKGPSLATRLKNQWMIWLGGVSIALAGVFLVRYSIEQGLLGPAARVILGLLTGLALHTLAEWGRRSNSGNYMAFAALAGGASAMLYAALLAAQLLYDLLPAWPVFILLTMVSLATMFLALWHGPVLAILGILGAYVVPLLVETGSRSILGLYIYSLIITVSAIMLMHYVYRPWLWLYMLAGSLGWWLLSLGMENADGFRGYYLAALVYCFLALPTRDWLLRQEDKANMAAAVRGIARAPVRESLVLAVIAMGVSISVDGALTTQVYFWIPLTLLVLLAAGNRGPLLWLPVLALGMQGLAWLALCLDAGNGIRLDPLDGQQQTQFLVYGGWMTFVYVALSLRNLVSGNRHVLWGVLAILVPLFWLALAYLLTNDLSRSLSWGSVAVGLGVLYLALAGWRLRQTGPGSAAGFAGPDVLAAWLIIAAHFAYSLAVAIMVREAGLTLALAAQLVTLAFIIRRFGQTRFAILMKLVLAVVVLRLTLNPWLLTYPVDVHWSLWTYGGSTLLVAIAAWHLRDVLALRQWLEAACLHLLVLALWAETRYQLYDGQIFVQRFDLTEAAINCALWSSLGLVYYLRHQVSVNLKALYLLASKIMLALGFLVYVLILLPLNPLWGGHQVSDRPVFNLLLLAFGFPLVIAILLHHYYDPAWRRHFSVFAGLAGFVFINLQIRHLWQGSVSVNLDTGNGELYTYTIVWLLLAIVSLLAGSLRYGRGVYRVGFALLMAVIGKIFLVDMADLEGLLRVASFMGLGLSLLGLAYLYQRFNLQLPPLPVDESAPVPSPRSSRFSS